MRQESLVKSISVRIRKRAYQVLDIPEADDGLSKLVTNALVLLICLNVIAVILESVENIGNNFGKIFFWFELSSVIIFTIEYIFRIWCCVESPDTRYKKPLIGRLKYIIKPLIIIDLLVIIPFYLSFIIGLDLRILRVIRLLRVVRLTRYSGAWSLFSAVIKAQQKPLIMTVFLLALALLIFSSLMYAIENTAQPQAFADIPSAMWWAVATLTTVGYGDIFPVTSLGKILGSISAIFGIGLFALPAGLLASGFSDEMQKEKKFCPHCGEKL